MAKTSQSKKCLRASVVPLLVCGAVMAGCDRSGSPRTSQAPLSQRLASRPGSQDVPEVRGLAARSAERKIRRSDLTPTPSARSSACTVVSQSPLAGAREEPRREVRLGFDCGRPSGWCGLIPGRRGIGVVVQHGHVACRDARLLMTEYLARAPKEGQGNGAFMQLGRWGCGITPQGPDPHAPFVACEAESGRLRVAAVDR